MSDSIKIVYIGNKGHHSSKVNETVKGNTGFFACGCAGGDPSEDITSFWEYLKEANPHIKKYDDYIEMLEAEKPDVAVVSPRFDLTAKVCIDCAERGVHILAEKPVALDLGELELLHKTVKESNIYFSAMHFIRFEGAFNRAISLVKSGAIGDVRLINAQKSYKLGTRDEFFKDRKTYGGTIPWVGIHGLDWIYAVSDGGFESVYASHSTVGNGGHGELEATCLCHFKLANGVAASLTVDYLRPSNAPTHGDDRLRVMGTCGCIEVMDGKLTVINDAGVKNYDSEPEYDFVTEFLLQIKGGKNCCLLADEVFDITRISLTALESADKGVELKL